MRKGTVIYMICPKCGQEYEGDKCPRCNGPEVIVNNADYLKRKMAYEEKQAGKGSASSDKETSENNTADVKNGGQEEVLPDEMSRSNVRSPPTDLRGRSAFTCRKSMPRAARYR